MATQQRCSDSSLWNFLFKEKAGVIKNLLFTLAKCSMTYL